jgi:hypothetical protein
VKLAVFDASRRNPFERRFRGVSSGLGAVDAPPGTLLMSAAATGKVAYDADGEHSLLMAELLKEINAPGLDAETVFNHTRIGVSRASSGEQVPLVSSSLVESFAFVSGARRYGRPTAALAPKPAVRSETVETGHYNDALAAPDKPAHYELAAKPVDPTPVAPKAVEATAEAKPIEQPPAEQKTAPVAKAKKTKAADDVKRSRRPMHEVTREIEREPSRPVRRNWWQAEAERKHRMDLQHERRMMMMERNMHRRLFGGLGF